MPRKPDHNVDVDFVLPASLQDRRADLLKAQTSKLDPMAWSEGDSFREAYAPAAIARILIDEIHPLLVGKRIAYLWKEKMAKNHQTVLGRARVASGMVKHFSEMDFVIEFNFETWPILTERERCALVDHELTHCTTDGDDEKPSLVGHDIEEFGSIVKKWGLWQPDLERFGKVVVEVAQLPLGV